jgi:molecular chaperone GrpE
MPSHHSVPPEDSAPRINGPLATGAARAGQPAADEQPNPVEESDPLAKKTASDNNPEGTAAESEPSGSDTTHGESTNDASTKIDDGNSIDDKVVATFESELAEAKRQADEHNDRYLRAEADLQNLRRRSDQRRTEALTHQKRDLLARFLDVRDNLDRGLGHAGEDVAGSPLVEGLQATLRVMDQLLEREGVAPIEAEGATFDPHVHEAMAVVPMPDIEQEVVLSVDRPGYTLGGELLRPARVVVGRPAE